MSLINMLELYIKKIHNVQELNQYDPPMYIVDLTYDNYGNDRRSEITFTQKDWLNAQKNGWFWG